MGDVGQRWPWAGVDLYQDDPEVQRLRAYLRPDAPPPRPNNAGDEPYPDAHAVLEEYGLHEYPVPTYRDVQAWVLDSVVPSVGCECDVEPDGTCPHGRPSWLRALGLV